MEENRKRILFWDNIKGVLIFLVVFAHALYSLCDIPIIDTVVKVIYTFHMPVFIFVSGYFGKSERSQSAGGIAKLVFSYLLFNTLTGFIYGFENLLIPLYSYWYILALVLWRLTAKYVSKFRFALFIAVIAGLLVGFVPFIDNTLALSRFIAFYPFYLAGYRFTGENFRLKKIPVGIVSLGIAACLIPIVVNNPVNAFLMESYSHPIYILLRCILWGIAAMMTLAFICLTPDRKIPFLTDLGRNSLSVFLFHRIFTLLIPSLYGSLPAALIILCAFILSVAICFVFGNNPFNRVLSRFIDDGGAFLRGERKNPAIGAICIALAIGLVVSSVLPVSEKKEPTDTIFPVITDEQETAFDNAFRLVFAGDLILLEDQVKRGYDGENYDFSDVFEYAEPYISSADLAIGVFEGPLAGEDAGYSSSNYDDGKELALNYPDEFATAVKNAGFDLVTTANNHFLDKGTDGALRTLDVLDKTGLDHTGTYRNYAEKEADRVKIIEVGGLRFAVLSYTYASNGYSAEELSEGELACYTSVISGTKGKLFNRLKKQVEEDFSIARSMSPDFIIVLPHIGTQFENAPDEEQNVWFEIFRENGADIILGDHSHAVQPVSITIADGKTVFEAFCPGNFANSYRENDGDVSALAEVYIDASAKRIIGGGVVPLYTQAPVDGNYRAIPLNEIMNNEELRSTLSTDDLVRAAEANEIVTRVMLGSEIDISAVTSSYLFNENGYLRRKTKGLSLTDEQKKGVLWSSLSTVSSVCFLGDSLTEGTKNGGCPWYEPIEEYLDGKEIVNFSKGGCTISYLIENIEQIPQSELYVIAVGTNDVRYRDEDSCAMTADEYLESVRNLRTQLTEKNPTAILVWIAPWYSTDGDPYCPLSFAEKTELNKVYSLALSGFADASGDGYININSQLEKIFSTQVCSNYLLDHIHPNSAAGVRLYSELVLESQKNTFLPSQGESDTFNTVTNTINKTTEKEVAGKP